MKKFQVRSVKATILDRFLAELWLFNCANTKDTVLCFGNLPPLFKLSSFIVVYLQNRYLVEGITLKGFSVQVRLRIMLERIWFSLGADSVNQIIVQTKTMKTLLFKRLRNKVPIAIFPFLENPVGFSRKLSNATSATNYEYDFVYVASGEPHKNHLALINAWNILADEGLYPKLCLTLSDKHISDLFNKFDLSNEVKIENAGVLSHKDVLLLYQKSKAMIYPSKYESLGLPLIEARRLGLPILAAELDYVRDLIDPEQTFDPESPVSIARAVKRFMGMEEEALRLLDPAQFLESIFKRESL
jgi:glycosyltransferase involved in cell wall biosynthesis